MKCSICGSANLIEGTIVAAETRTGVYIFEPSDNLFSKECLASAVGKLAPLPASTAVICNLS